MKILAERYPVNINTPLLLALYQWRSVNVGNTDTVDPGDINTVNFTLSAAAMLSVYFRHGKSMKTDARVLI